jgi:hypothetical protein
MHQVSFTMQARARLALFSPGAPLARKLAQNPTVLIVNDSVFAHGGLLPVHGESPRPPRQPVRGGRGRDR